MAARAEMPRARDGRSPATVWFTPAWFWVQVTLEPGFTVVLSGENANPAMQTAPEMAVARSFTKIVSRIVVWIEP